jgi:CheY-like chemotaxis protein
MNRVLVVDDDPVACQLSADALRGAGYPVDQLHDGQEAVRQFHQHPYFALVCDLDLPGMNGLEVCRAARSSPWGRSAYIVMLTPGSVQRDHAAPGLEAGVDAFVPKPVDPSDLVKHVRLGQWIVSTD